MGNKNKNELKARSLLDIVIPVHSNFEMLEQSLLAIPNAIKDVTYRIFLVDDLSPDYESKGKGFYQYLRNNLPNLGGILVHNKNVGYPQSCNDGANLGSSKLVMILSTDVILTEGSIKLMAEHLDGSPEVGAVFPKLLFFPNTNNPEKPAGKIQHCGLVFGIDRRPHHIYSGWDADHPFVNRVKDYNAFTGATFIMRRDLWRRLKGFDPAYGLGTYEDCDLSIRARMTGALLRYLPQAVGYHGVGISAEMTGKGFPLNRNFDYFRSKFGDNIPFDEWIV